MSKAVVWSLLIVVLIGAVAFIFAQDEESELPDTAPELGNDLSWFDDHALGLKKASDESRLIVIDAWANWCSSCKKLWKDTFMDPRVQDRLKSYVRVKLNMDEKKNVLYWEQYSMNGGLPWVGFLTPDGIVHEEHTLRDYEAPDSFLERLDAFEASVGR